MSRTTKYDLSRLSAIYEQSVPEFHEPRGNSKLGLIPAWNIAPVLTCAPEACGTCAVTGCYAFKNMLQHGYSYENNSVLRAWMDNTRLAKEDLPRLEKQLDAFLTIMELSISSGKYFRIHSGGDFFNLAYLAMWARLIAKHPKIKFLAFTKQFDVLRAYDAENAPLYRLENLSVVLSAWPGCEPPEDLKEHYQCAYCIEEGQEVPEGSIECPGNCDTCGVCWSLAKLGKSAWFHKH